MIISWSLGNCFYIAESLASNILGPYRIAKVVPEKGTYFLKELNGTCLLGTIAGNRLKRFHPVRDSQMRSQMQTSLNPTNPSTSPSLHLENNSLATSTSFSSGLSSSGPFEKLGRTFLCHEKGYDAGLCSLWLGQ